MTYTNRDFNPSGSYEVDAIKEAADNFAFTIAQLAKDGPLKDKALIDVQSASMFAVKSLFSKV